MTMSFTTKVLLLCLGVAMCLVGMAQMGYTFS